MTIDLPLRCKCGKVQGLIKDVSNDEHARQVCLCDDCQAYAHYLGRAKDILDSNGGTDIFHTTPAQFKITKGLEHLKCLQLKEKGTYRWYTECCKTPVGNTASTAKMPHVGVIHSFLNPAAVGKTLNEAIGPVYARVMGKFGIGKLPEGTYQKVSVGVIGVILKFFVSSLIKRRHKPNLFFNAENGKPISQPYVLAPHEREELRKFCGPQPTR